MSWDCSCSSRPRWQRVRLFLRTRHIELQPTPWRSVHPERRRRWPARLQSGRYTRRAFPSLFRKETANLDWYARRWGRATPALTASWRLRATVDTTHSWAWYACSPVSTTRIVRKTRRLAIFQAVEAGVRRAERAEIDVVVRLMDPKRSYSFARRRVVQRLRSAERLVAITATLIVQDSIALERQTARHGPLRTSYVCD
jgi:hypothetical protein